MDALVGYTGFVGGNLLRQRRFDAFYNSANIDDIRGNRFELLVCAGTPALMYRANQEPADDFATIRRLIDALATVEARRCVLISTIYVYRNLVGVDEGTPVSEEALLPYGRHRLMLETWIRTRFEATAIRLPNIFGDGIKKNVLFDLLVGNQIDKIHSSSVYQYYSLDHVWSDISNALEHRLPILNLATEPLSVAEIAEDGVGMSFQNVPPTPPAHCQVQTIHAGLWGKSGPYLYSKAEVLQDIRQFVTRYRSDSFSLAVSSVAWSPADDEAMRDVLVDLGVRGIELSADRLLDEFNELSGARVAAQREFWAARGISVVAVQRVLFGREFLRLFESEENRSRTNRYLKDMIVNLGGLGANVLMFGAPRNRRRGSRSNEEADRIAVPFFNDLARFAYLSGVVFCIEPNPEMYGADYVMTTSEACELTKKVNHPGFGVNLDTGAMITAGETADVILGAPRLIRHVHVSQPGLGPVEGIDETVHSKLASVLRQIKYTGWLSIEMTNMASGGQSSIERVIRAVEKVKAVYDPNPLLPVGHSAPQGRSFGN